MKRLFALLIIATAITSCSVDDNNSPNYHYEFMPVETVDVPNSMIVNFVYEISMSYLRPNSCYGYNDIYYFHDDETTRTVAVICTVYDTNDTGCGPLDYPEYDVSFNFKPTQVGIYTFKFWQGEDENGEDHYTIVEVPVSN